MKTKVILLCLIFFIGCNTNDKNSVYQKKQELFSLKGFGIDILGNTVYDIKEFISNYGQPIEYSERIISWGSIDRYIEATLEYDNFNVIFHKDKSEELIIIISKDNVEYMFGVKHDMNLKDLENIFGKLFKYNSNVYISGFSFQDSVGAIRNRYTEIVLDKNRIKSITWWIFSMP
jgi:hypothetical protein